MWIHFSFLIIFIFQLFSTIIVRSFCGKYCFITIGGSNFFYKFAWRGSCVNIKWVFLLKWTEELCEKDGHWVYDKRSCAIWYAIKILKDQKEEFYLFWGYVYTVLYVYWYLQFTLQLYWPTSWIIFGMFSVMLCNLNETFAFTWRERIFRDCQKESGRRHQFYTQTNFNQNSNVAYTVINTSCI